MVSNTIPARETVSDEHGKEEKLRYPVAAAARHGGVSDCDTFLVARNLSSRTPVIAAACLASSLLVFRPLDDMAVDLAFLADVGPSTLVQHAFITRYITMIACTAAFYDAILMLPKEIEKVWRRRSSRARSVYLVNRYTTFLCLTLQVYAFSCIKSETPLTDYYCKIAMALNFTIGTLSLGVANYLVLLKVWALWEHAKWVIYVTTAAWASCYATTMVLVVLSIIGEWEGTFSAARFGFNCCAITHKPALMSGIWAAPLVFELLIFIFTLWNAADRPRKKGVTLMRALRGDGLVFFLTLFLLRVFNLLSTILLPLSLTFLGSGVIWAAMAITLGRLILHWQDALDAEDAHRARAAVELAALSDLGLDSPPPGVIVKTEMLKSDVDVAQARYR